MDRAGATMSKINRVIGRRIYDSRGRPTIEVEVSVSTGISGRGIAPAGASRGIHEALEMRDGGNLLGGFDVSRAIALVNSEISDALAGMDVHNQRQVDETMIALDGTASKSRLGANSLIATSMAVLNAAAAHARQPLWRYLSNGKAARIPLPEIQIFGGGAHAGRRVDIQDFLIVPLAAESFSQAMIMASDVYWAAGAIMAEKSPPSGVADEGGWWPNFATNEEGLDILARSIRRAGYDDGRVAISLDIAASEFGRSNRYRPALEGRDFTREEWMNVVLQWIKRYPIVSVEDPMSDIDTDGMIEFTRAAPRDIQIIGDDYLVTNAGRIAEAHADDACNAVLIKPNQAGTITETLAALTAAQAVHWGTIMSARSGESEDVSIAHLAVGWNAGQLKVGSFSRSERMAKWNEVLRIEEMMGGEAQFAGKAALSGIRTAGIVSADADHSFK